MVNSLTVSGNTLELGRSESLPTLTVGLPIATYARSTPSGTIADAQIPSGIARDSELPTNATIDVRIANYARAAPSGQIADAQVPGTIARDTELPDTSALLERSDVVAGTNITLTNGAGNTFTIAAAGGSGGGLTSVSSDSTLQGDGTAADLLGLTDVEVNQLDSVPGLLAETADLSIEVISRTWTDGTDVAAGGFVSHGSGNAITVAEAAALTYFRHTRCHKRGRPA